MTTPTTDLVQQLRSDIAAVIRAEPWFAPIEVIDNAEGDIVERMKVQVGKLGLVVVVELFPRGRVEFGISDHSIEFTAYVTITEQPLLNRSSSGSGKTIGDALLRLVSLFNPNVEPSKPCTLNEITIAGAVENAKYIVYQLRGPATLGFHVSPDN